MPRREYSTMSSEEASRSRSRERDRRRKQARESQATGGIFDPRRQDKDRFLGQMSTAKIRAAKNHLYWQRGAGFVDAKQDDTHKDMKQHKDWRRLLVKNVPRGVDTSTLVETLNTAMFERKLNLYENFPAVLSCFFPQGLTGRAYVEFASWQEAQQALRLHAHITLYGNTLEIERPPEVERRGLPDFMPADPTRGDVEAAPVDFTKKVVIERKARAEVKVDAYVAVLLVAALDNAAGENDEVFDEVEREILDAAGDHESAMYPAVVRGFIVRTDCQIPAAQSASGEARNVAAGDMLLEFASQRDAEACRAAFRTQMYDERTLQTELLTRNEYVTVGRIQGTVEAQPQVPEVPLAALGAEVDGMIDNDDV